MKNKTINKAMPGSVILASVCAVMLLLLGGRVLSAALLQQTNSASLQNAVVVVTPDTPIQSNAPMIQMANVPADVTALKAQGFNLFMPANLGSAYSVASVSRVQRTDNPGFMGSQVLLRRADGSFMALLQEHLTQSQHELISQDRWIKDVDINGQRGVIYDARADNATEPFPTLVWFAGDNAFRLSGAADHPATVDELVAIATSLAPLP